MSDGRPERSGVLGTPREGPPALIIAAVERGRVVGYSGRDRPVYEVDIGVGPFGEGVDEFRAEAEKFV
ncbi:hypothetical protein FHR81_002647 [Actinoalloteichus hoggarensis]|nr:hypothetical protein [Actinoalloteichus hoggarensis]MBB5921607.1 hypothetical protein [Actinoalloteichus hoggarensis]